MRLLKRIKFNRTTIILGLIVLLGIFLRVYNFREWLYFYPDQARDLMIVRDYLNGNLPLPLLGFKAASTRFELGAMYYYFQIISGWIFGIAPQTMAYPDLFFNILSIPLFYYFLRQIFKKETSFVLTGLYSISFYSIEYSRFAWNPNPMPFFVLLFLLSLWKLMTMKEKTAWKWIAILGITLGIGIQLHTILLYLLPFVAFFVLLKVGKNNPMFLRQCLVVILLALVLNTNQIISETKTNFYNVRQLFALSVGASKNGSVGGDLMLDVVCHAQANSHILTSLGNKLDCDNLDILSKYLKQKGIIKTGNINLLLNPDKQISHESISIVLISLLFSIVGYISLVYYYKKEKDNGRKKLLGLIIFYAAVSFVVLFPVIGDAPLRYYLQVFFVPFLFVGFFIEYLQKKYKIITMPILAVGIIFLGYSNLNTIISEAKIYASQEHSNPRYVVLGELENMTDFVQKTMGSNSTIYMTGDDRCMQNYFKPFTYTFSERNIIIARISKRTDEVPINGPIFYIGNEDAGKQTQINGFKVDGYKKFGAIGIYILKN